MGARAVKENEARSVAQALLHAHVAEEHVNSALLKGERMWWHSIWVKCVKVLGGDHVDIVAWIEDDVVNGMSYDWWSGQAAEDCFVELHGAGAGRREDNAFAHAEEGGFVYLVAVHLSDEVIVSAKDGDFREFSEVYTSAKSTPRPRVLFSPTERVKAE